jgi:hypothetical protein
MAKNMQVLLANRPDGWVQVAGCRNRTSTL